MKGIIVAGSIIGLSVLVLGWDVTSAARVNTHLARTAAELRDAPLSGPPRALQALPTGGDADSLRRALLVRRQMLQSPITRSVTAPTWTALGPSDVGGRINAILTNSANHNEIFVGTAGGGIWHSTDGAKSWASVGDFLGSLAVSALARVPHGSVTCATTDLLLAGTGDQFNPARGVGILLSSDGGSTWNPLVSTDPTSNHDWFYVNSIAVNPSGVILVGTGVAPTSLAWGDIYKSTDCGVSFTKVSVGVSEDVAFDPNHPNDAVAEDEDGTVRYSTDAGSTWSTPVSIASGGGRVTLAYAQATLGWVYAAVDDAPSTTTGPSGSLYLSPDGGLTWAKQGAPSGGLLCYTTSCQGNYDNVLWVDPLNSSIVVAGGINLFESSNGGGSWSQISDWTNTPTSPHADHHVLAADAGFNGTTDTTFFDGDDGGFYSTGDVFTATTTTGWTEDNSGLADTQFYSVSGYAGGVAKQNGNIVPIVGGTQDNGTQLYDMNSANPAAWTMIYGGDGGITDIDPLDADYVYGEYTNLDLFQSTQGGLNANAFTSLPKDSNSGKTALFIAPMLLDPTTDNAMFAGGASLWYANVKGNLNPSWRSLNGTTGLTLPSNSIISAIGVDPLDDNDVWVSLLSGALYHSTNALSGTPSWTQSGAATLPTTAELESIYIDPSNSNRLYLAYFSRTGGSLWESKDSGSTWIDLSGGLPQVPVHDVTTDARSHMLIVATELGLFESADDGTTWTTNAGGPANVEIMKLKWFDPCSGQLLAATYGRGMFLGQVPNAGSVSASTPQAGGLTPSSVAVGAADTLLEVTGSNFTACSTVNWNGTALATRYVSSGELIATVPAADLAASGYASVTIDSSASGGGTSSALKFGVASPAPSLNSISPTSATAGSAGFTLQVLGTNFQTTSQVEWNGTALSTTYVSAGEVDASVTAADLAQSGNVSVSVNTPLPGGGTSGSGTFTVKPGAGSGGSGGGGGDEGLGAIAMLLIALARKRR